MKKILTRLLLGYCLSMTTAQLAAQPVAGNLVLYQLTEQHGLSDNQVTCFFHDSNGFMWIGTRDGLNRYDGSAITVFKKKGTDSTQLADNYIHAITEDVQHHIWIATGNGLSEYDPVKNTFRSWQEKSGVKDINILTSLAISKNGDIWIASFGGLLRFIPAQQKFIRYPNTAHTDPVTNRSDNRFTQLLIDKSDRFWISSFNGLWRFFPQQNSFEEVVANPGTNSTGQLINTIFQDHAQRLWLGYWSAGIKLLEPATKQVQDFSKLPNAPHNVFSMAEIKSLHGEYNLWSNDLRELNSNRQSFNAYLPLKPELGSDYKNVIVYASKDNLLWVGTHKGVRIMDPAKQFFQTSFLSATEITPQSMALLQKNAGIYIGGRDAHFLQLYDSSFRLIKTVLPQLQVPKGNTLTSPALINLVREDDHRIWLCMEEGLVLFDETSNHQQLFLLSAKDINTPTRNFISNLFIDSRGTHWVFPWRSGIWQLDVQQGRFKKIITSLPSQKEPNKNLLVVTAVEDDQTNLWFADLDEGLIFYDRSTGAFSKPTKKVIDSTYALQNVVYEKPYIWCATTGRVFRIHTQTKQVDLWPVPDEWNKMITGFCSDSYHHLWITTNSGLLSFDKRSHQFQRFTANDGLPDNVMKGVLYPLQNGNILYGDNNYVTTFNPQQMIKTTAIPPVLITTILSLNKPVTIHHNKNEKYIDLDYRYNNFTFNWAVLNYSNPLQNRYYCQLEGIDKDWRYVGNKGEVQYASLLPGKYTLRVKGATSDGIMNTTGDAVNITIHPPFWKTWWFITSILVLASAMVYSIYRYRLNRALEMERLRMKISTDLHDDIGSTLSSISILSDMVLKDAGSTHSGEMVKEIKDNSVTLMEKMDDIVWSINPKNDSLESLLLRIKRVAPHLFEAKSIEYDFCIHETIKQVKLPMDYRQHIYLVIKEAINNLVKYSACTKATVNVTFAHHQLLVTIQDNGKGFDNSAIVYGNGILSMQHRAALMKGRLDIQSATGKGTTVTLAVKIK